MQDILVELQLELETWRYDAEGKELRYVAYVKGIHKRYRHPAKSGMCTYERAFKKKKGYKKRLHF